jgi:hypothetical protein
MEMISPAKDIINVDIPIDVKSYTLPDGSSTTSIPLELIICKKKDVKNVFSNFAYLKNFVF